MRGLESVSRSVTTMDICLNGGALTETGRTLEGGAEKIYTNLLRAGWQVKEPEMIKAQTLQNVPVHLGKAFGIWT